MVVRMHSNKKFLGTLDWIFKALAMLRMCLCFWYYPILLWSIRDKIFFFFIDDALICEHSSIFLTGKFVAIVSPNSFNGNPKLNLYHFYIFAQNIKVLSFKVHHTGPCSCMIINNSEELLSTNSGCLFIKTPYVNMEKSQTVLSYGIARKRSLDCLARG